MIKIIEGSLLNATEDLICHQVNCQGVMGSGVAKALTDRYPELKFQYQKYCEREMRDCNPSTLLGNIYIYFPKIDSYERCLGIINLFGQNSYGRKGGSKDIIFTDYTALEIAFIRLRDYAVPRGFSIAMPYNIGCGLANGSWAVVFAMIERVFFNTDVTLYKI